MVSKKIYGGGDPAKVQKLIKVAKEKVKSEASKPVPSEPVPG